MEFGCVLSACLALEHSELRPSWLSQIMDHPKQTDTMREALEVIGEELKSEEIKRFLATGEIGSEWFLLAVALLPR